MKRLNPGEGLAVFLLLGILGSTLTSEGQSPSIIEVGKFSAMVEGAALPSTWKPLTFPKIEKHTVYALVKDESVVVMKAQANASASGLIREIRIDAKDYPFVEWRWKVGNILRGGDVQRKEGDDYPARLYIAFEADPGKLSFGDRIKYEAARLLYGQTPPLRAINYIWEGKATVGTMIPNPYNGRTMMIVVESGAQRVGQWITEKRNVEEDYKQAFQEEPPMISGVAIMTDTDNTGESAVAYYGDIRFRRGENE